MLICTKQRSRSPFSYSYRRFPSSNWGLARVCGSPSPSWPLPCRIMGTEVERDSQHRQPNRQPYISIYRESPHYITVASPLAIMGTSPRLRTRQPSGLRKGSAKAAREADSRRSTHTSLASSAQPLSPATNTLSGAEPALRATQHDSENGPEDIAAEIVVWTEDMDSMIVDSPEPATPAPPTQDEKAMYVFVLPIHLSPTLCSPIAPSCPSRSFQVT